MVFTLSNPTGPLNSGRETRAPSRKAPALIPHWTYSVLALRGHLQVMPGNICLATNFGGSTKRFLSGYVLDLAQTLTHYNRSMAESPSAGSELQDENGKKLFSCLRIQDIHIFHMHVQFIIMFLLTHFNRCTSSGGYVRTNSTSKQVTRGSVIWTIRTIDKNVSHKTKVRTFSTSGNISLFVLLLCTGQFQNRPSLPRANPGAFGSCIY